MKKTVLVKDPGEIKLFTNEENVAILSLLVKRDMTNAQIAKALGRQPQQTLRVINRLKDAGLVEQTKTKMVKNLQEKYYRARARQFTLDLKGFKQDVAESESD
jgi:transcription initiation factor IIE alpha subunit